MNLTATDRVRLFGWSQEVETPVVSGTFGELVRRAQPIVVEHTGDLFYDARWLDRHLVGDAFAATGRFEFWWGCNRWGTAIGTDRDAIGPIRRNLWRVAVIRERNGEWFVELTPVVREGVSS
jgi:hypothetical protein